MKEKHRRKISTGFILNKEQSILWDDFVSGHINISGWVKDLVVKDLKQRGRDG